MTFLTNPRFSFLDDENFFFPSNVTDVNGSSVQRGNHDDGGRSLALRVRANRNVLGPVLAMLDKKRSVKFSARTLA